MKKILCLVLSAVIMLSLTACNIMGAGIFMILSAIDDDRKDKEDIFEYVNENKQELLDAIESNDFSDIEGKRGIKSVSVENGSVEFSCGGAGMGSGTAYCGFYYTADNDITSVWCAPSTEDKIKPHGEGYLWEQTDGDNRYYTQQICDCFWYYEASF